VTDLIVEPARVVHVFEVRLVRFGAEEVEVCDLKVRPDYRTDMSASITYDHVSRAQTKPNPKPMLSQCSHSNVGFGPDSRCKQHPTFHLQYPPSANKRKTEKPTHNDTHYTKFLYCGR
jgi:hypothetical protein